MCFGLGVSLDGFDVINCNNTVSSEEFPRVVMKVERHARTKKAKTDILDFETKETETKVWYLYLY